MTKHLRLFVYDPFEINTESDLGSWWGGGGGEGTGGNKWQDMQMKPQFNTSKKYFSGKNKAQNIKHLK